MTYYDGRKGGARQVRASTPNYQINKKTVVIAIKLGLDLLTCRESFVSIYIYIIYILFFHFPSFSVI